MAKATLSYDISSDEDAGAFRAAVAAMDLALAVNDHYEYLRQRLKYDVLDDAAHQAIEQARDNLTGMLREHGVDLDRIVF